MGNFRASSGLTETDENTLRSIFVQLCSSPTPLVESENLEVKNWCRDERQLGDKLSEAVTCIANAHGGIVLAGIEDDDVRGPKFGPCPYPNVRPEWITQRIQDNTVPPVEISVYDVSDLLQQVTGNARVNCFAIFVPQTKRVGGHQTIDGTSKIRRGKECRPYYMAALDDRTKAPVTTATVNDLSIEWIDWALEQHQKKFQVPKQHWESPHDFLSHVGLLENEDTQHSSPQMSITLAAMLLFGRESSLQKFLIPCETILVEPRNTTRYRRNIVETFRLLLGSRAGYLAQLCHHIGLQTLKEVLVNAYIHRSYREQGSITIHVTSTELVVESPGPLPVGLNPENLIHCTPVYRNFLLAEGARYVGICDKIGRGIDCIYEQVLFGGIGFPRFENGENCFTVRIPLESSREFQEFVKRRAQALTQLDDVIVLRLLYDRDSVPYKEICNVMQRSFQHGHKILEDMSRKLMIEPVDGMGVQWRLAPAVRSDIQHIFQSDQYELGLGDLFGE